MTQTMPEQATSGALRYAQIDSDSHIQEAGGSWEMYLDPAYESRRPVIIDNPHVPGRPHRNKTWYLDGQLVPKNQGPAGVVMSTPVEMDFAQGKAVAPDIQACTNPTARADLMLGMGIDRTVMFSTLFLQAFTDDLGYEAALMRSWNRWMADVTADYPALKYAALVPVRDATLAAAEVRFAKANGAATVMILPAAGDKLLHDPVLDPFWAACVEQDMPVSIHIGWPQPRVTNEATTPSTVFLGAFETSLWWAYVSVFTGGLFERFPGLRVAFMEHDARWFELFMARSTHWYPTSAASPWPQAASPLDTLRGNPIYFSYEGDYAFLPRFLDIAGQDRVMGALDFPHTHYGTASLSIAWDLLRDHETLTDDQKRAVLRENALGFYGFDDI
jgi:uncharacterized protein